MDPIHIEREGGDSGGGSAQTDRKATPRTPSDCGEASQPAPMGAHDQGNNWSFCGPGNLCQGYRRTSRPCPPVARRSRLSPII